ncbi:MAG: DUF4469 domain-containing protein [Treponema sp.]|nr:DUF4469 domain-containing protein [Treponema sp.]
MIKNRTKYDGDYGELVQCVQRYFDEAAYQLCNGFSINTGYFRIQPNIGGHFKSPAEPFNPDKHHITMRFYPLAKLRRLIRDIKVTILGEANVTGFIGEVTDSYTGAVNDTVSSGETIIITGEKIKVADDGVNTDCGVFLELIDGDDAGKRLKVSRRLVENNPGKIICHAPELAAPQRYRVVIVTQFPGRNDALLKEPKTLTSGELFCSGEL